MQPVEVQIIVNGELRSVVMPPLQQPADGETPTLVPGPDVIVGDLPSVQQGGSNGTFVGLGVGTTSCNNGDQASALVFVTANGSSGYPTEFLPDERRRQ